MANKLAKRKGTNKKSTNMADQPDYETLANNIVDFTIAAIWVEKEIKKHRASNNKFDLAMTLDGITPGNKWASMKTVSHFNLGIALELMLKYLLLRNKGAYDPIHPLTALHDDLPPPVQERLESTYQDILSGGMFDLVALIRQPLSKQPPLENRPISSLREIFVYFDEDVKLWLKRYAWAAEEQKYWRHYLNDITVFATFMKHVIGNIEPYSAPADGAEQEGTGTGE